MEKRRILSAPGNTFLERPTGLRTWQTTGGLARDRSGTFTRLSLQTVVGATFTASGMPAVARGSGMKLPGAREALVHNAEFNKMDFFCYSGFRPLEEAVMTSIYGDRFTVKPHQR